MGPKPQICPKSAGALDEVPGFPEPRLPHLLSGWVPWEGQAGRHLCPPDAFSDFHGTVSLVIHLAMQQVFMDF